MEEAWRKTTADYTVKSWQDEEDAKGYSMNKCGGFKTTEIALGAKRTIGMHGMFKCVYHQTSKHYNISAAP